MTDGITRLITSIDSDILTQIDILVNNPLVYLIVVSAILLIGEKRNEKRLKVLVAILVSLVLAVIVNVGMAVERPCASLTDVICPMLYSFPSIHCTIAFIIMISFLEKKQYPFYVLFALMVAFSRLHLGVHVFRDIVGALLVGLLAYHITYIIWKRWKHE